MGQLEPWFLERLVCPVSKARLVEVGDWLYSTDPQNRRRYAIVDGIPNLLSEESEEVSEQDFRQVVQRAS